VVLSFINLLCAIGGGGSARAGKQDQVSNIRPETKNHQPRLRVVAWVLLNDKTLFVRLLFPRACWTH